MLTDPVASFIWKLRIRRALLQAIETVSKEQQKLLRHQAQEMASCKARIEEQSLLIEDLNSKLLHNEDLTMTPVPPGAPRPSVPTGPMPPRCGNKLQELPEECDCY